MKLAALVGLVLLASAAFAAERTVLWEYFTQTG
mgnify:CR=1 FL=1